VNNTQNLRGNNEYIRKKKRRTKDDKEKLETNISGMAIGVEREAEARQYSLLAYLQYGQCWCWESVPVPGTSHTINHPLFFYRLSLRKI
jgi:hypothetical protein